MRYVSPSSLQQWEYDEAINFDIKGEDYRAILERSSELFMKNHETGHFGLVVHLQLYYTQQNKTEPKTKLSSVVQFFFVFFCV